MDLFARLIMRMAVWVRHPPSRGQIYTLIAVTLLIGAVVMIEWLGYWPESWRTEPLPRGLPRPM